MEWLWQRYANSERADKWPIKHPKKSMMKHFRSGGTARKCVLGTHTSSPRFKKIFRELELAWGDADVHRHYRSVKVRALSSGGRAGSSNPFTPANYFND